MMTSSKVRAPHADRAERSENGAASIGRGPGARYYGNPGRISDLLSPRRRRSILHGRRTATLPGSAGGRAGVCRRYAGVRAGAGAEIGRAARARLDVAVSLGTVPVVVHRPVVPVLSRRLRRTVAAVVVHLAVRPAVLRLLFPLVHVVRVLRPAAAAAARLLLLHLGLFLLLHPLVFGAPVLEPHFDLRTRYVRRVKLLLYVKSKNHFIIHCIGTL